MSQKIGVGAKTWGSGTRFPSMADPLPRPSLASCIALIPIFVVSPVASEVPNLSVNLLDLRSELVNNGHDHNAILWGESTTAGLSYEEDQSGRRIAIGGYQDFEHHGLSSTIGINYVDAGDTNSIEAQVEVRGGMLGAGAGVVSQDHLADIWFVKGRFAWKKKKTTLVIAPILQKQLGKTRGGGYVNIDDGHAMFGASVDGQQWRMAGTYIFPETNGLVRPAAEILYIDPTLGGNSDPQLLFANATLRYEPGFFSRTARLGRALGPQGIHTGNPVSFTSLGWNRTADIWEIGRLANFRVLRSESSDETVQLSMEGIVFPAHILAPTDDFRSGWYGGWRQEHLSRSKRSWLLIGATGLIGPRVRLSIHGSLAVSVQNESSIVLSLIIAP